MKTRVKKWGNSLALRIPGPLAKEMGLKEEAPVELAVADGKLIVAPLTDPVYDLEDLLRRVTEENLHREVKTGPRVGVEAW